MRYSWKQLNISSTERSRFPLIEDAVSYVRTLPPSDRLIAYVLLGFTALTCAIGLLALQRSFLIEEPAYGGSFREVAAQRITVRRPERLPQMLGFDPPLGADAQR